MSSGERRAREIQVPGSPGQIAELTEGLDHPGSVVDVLEEAFATIEGREVGIASDLSDGLLVDGESPGAVLDGFQ